MEQTGEIQTQAPESATQVTKSFALDRFRAVLNKFQEIAAPIGVGVLAGGLLMHNPDLIHSGAIITAINAPPVLARLLRR